MLEEAANSIAGMYEAMNDVYKVSTPICEANHDFHKLAKIHAKLKLAFNCIAQIPGKRVLELISVLDFMVINLIISGSTRVYL